VISQRVSQRIPLGAQISDLLALVARQGGAPVLVGLAVGVVCVLAFGRVLASTLYATQPSDPRLLVSVSATLVLATALAIAVPARRAARVDPMIALRDE
jgi:putative ABC transport system permease protein